MEVGQRGSKQRRSRNTLDRWHWTPGVKIDPNMHNSEAAASNGCRRITCSATGLKSASCSASWAVPRAHLLGECPVFSSWWLTQGGPHCGLGYATGSHNWPTVQLPSNEPPYTASSVLSMESLGQVA